MYTFDNRILYMYKTLYIASGTKNAIYFLLKKTTAVHHNNDTKTNETPSRRLVACTTSNHLIKHIVDLITSINRLVSQIFKSYNIDSNRINKNTHTESTSHLSIAFELHDSVVLRNQ